MPPSGPPPISSIFPKRSRRHGRPNSPVPIPSWNSRRAATSQEIRRQIIANTTLSVGCVPLYQAFIEAAIKDGAVVNMKEDDLFRITAEQAKLGTNFMAIHTGINWETVKRLKNQGRHAGLVSRGGAFMTAWMLHNEKENPLYAEFDYLLEIMKEHEVTLSMGNGMRAGAIHDATDRAGIQELLINAELADKAHNENVQVIVEGPGHVPIDEIATNVQLMKRVTNNKPFYMLGPIVTDIAPGYDDRVAAIGAAISSSLGADFICYVTPAEHLALPTPEEVYEGVMSSRIAAHVGDMVKLKKTRDADLEMGHARRDLDWDRQFAVAMNPARAKADPGRADARRHRWLHDVRGLLRDQDRQQTFQILNTGFRLIIFSISISRDIYGILWRHAKIIA